MISQALHGLPDAAPISSVSLSPTGGADRFARLAHDNVDFVWRSARRLGIPRNDCEDAVQQILYIAYSKLASIELGSERAFLFATARRIAANARRANRRREEVQHQLDHGDLGSVPTPDDLTDQLRTRRLMDAVLDEMSPELRAVFVLFELEELSLLEIATMMKIPRGTVSSRLRRAREIFREIVAAHRGALMSSAGRQ